MTGKQIIQIMDDDRRLFYLSANKFKSFYVSTTRPFYLESGADVGQELGIAVRSELIRAGQDDVDAYQLPFELSNHQPVTAGKWASLMKQAEIPSIRVSLDPLSSHDSDQGSFVRTPNSTPEASDDEAPSDKISLGPASSDRLSRRPPGPQRYSSSRKEDQLQTDSSSTAKADDKGFILLSSETTTLNKPEYSFELSTDEWLVTVEEYFDVSLRVPESFVWLKFRSTLVSKCLGALAMIMKDPTQGLARRGDGSDVDDPDFVEPPIRDTPPRFVISRTRTLEDGVRYRDPAGKDEKCKDCSRDTVYTNSASTLAHLRLSHIIGSIAEDRLHYYVVPVEVALLERRREGPQELLQTSRNMIIVILQKLVYIQDDAIYGDDFREQRVFHINCLTPPDG
ncbi:hypothetical protein DL765_005284 [Monosporascus sp. GIB2]|nr:hypothetical protein DL765_005284 [Monosporascus sp. GIB2]